MHSEYNRLSNDNADWYCHLCIIDIFPFNKLEEFEFQLALAEFSIGHAKIGFKSLDKLHINPVTLNIINTDKVVDESNDPDLNFFNETVKKDKYLLDNELNKLLQDLNINSSFLNCLKPLYQSETWCSTIHMKMSLIYV